MNLPNEMPFRIASAILLALFTGGAWYFQEGRKRSQTIVVKHEQRERLFFFLSGLVWIPMLLYVLSSWIDSAHLPVPVWLRWVGSIILLSGIVCFFWTHQTLGKNWSGILEIRKDHSLVLEGSYRYVRHPMYAAIFLVGTGMALLSANWLVAVTYLGFFIVLYLSRVSAEEEMMLEQFGDAYREYMQSTGRLIPRFRHRKANRNPNNN